MSNIKQASSNIISLFVHDNISVFEMYEATSCSFNIIQGISFGYQYTKTENFENNLSYAYGILFDETEKRLKSKGVHLSL